MWKSLMAATALALVTTTAGAHGGRHHHHQHHHHHHDRTWWVAPAVIAGVVTYAITRPQVEPPPQVIQVPPAPPGWRYETILDARCNCYRVVLVNH